MKISEGLKYLRKKLLNYGEIVKTKKWQGEDLNMTFIELLHVSIKCQMEEDHFSASVETDANQPWALTHFNERTSGCPFNPPPSHKQWNKGTEGYLNNDLKFSHSYPERMWSKGLHSGIRFDIADLNTLVDLLKKEPDTRQAYLPIFFPEDLNAALQDERVPCTLGWHFIIRNNRMDVFYPMRSCDALRHVHNDFYFANMLALWIRDELGSNIKMGILNFHATSFHAFENDRYPLNKLVKD